MKRYFLAFFFFLASVMGFSQEQKPELVYIIDPLCGWCYSFNPIAEQLYEKYKTQLKISVISGGMVTGKRVKPVSSIAAYILEGYEDIEEGTGAKFGDKYLEMVRKGTELLDSEKPSRALTVMQSTYPEKTLSFNHDLQKLYFSLGYSLNQDSTYQILAQKYHLNEESFLQKMNSDTIKALTLSDFKKVDEAGINGFPTILLKVNGKVILITEGYEKLEKLEKKINKELKENNG